MAIDLLRMSVRCDEQAPNAVREALSRIDELEGIVPDVMLIASELVSNAVMHSACTSEDLLEIRVTRDGRVRLCVIDPGGHTEAKLADRPMGLGGLGLKIVDELADNWGSHLDGEGHEVWAELRLPTA
jgi:anti-sigma regulatory factor (Ser/Thr protein kinase)